jgi:hypothetical protein
MSHISPCVGGSLNLWICIADEWHVGDVEDYEGYIADIIKGIEFWGKSAVDTEELLIQDGRQRQGAERLHTCIVDPFGVFVFAWGWR